MPQPKKKMSNTRSGNRRSQIRLHEVTLISCVKCKSPIPQHQVCPVCGYYGDKKVIDLDKKEKKVEQANTEKEEAK